MKSNHISKSVFIHGILAEQMFLGGVNVKLVDHSQFKQAIEKAK